MYRYSPAGKGDDLLGMVETGGAVRLECAWESETETEAYGLIAELGLQLAILRKASKE